MKPRFQFRLRTVLIVVTLIAVMCGHVGWQARIVQERKALLRTYADTQVRFASFDERRDSEIPLLRRWFGDHFVNSIALRASGNAALYEAAFPEADVTVDTEKWAAR
jgi:hypothetical protein